MGGLMAGEPMVIISTTWIHDGTGSDVGPTNGILLWPGVTDEGHEVLPVPGTVVDAVFREYGEADRPVRVEVTGIRVVVEGVVAMLPGGVEWSDPATARAAWAKVLAAGPEAAREPAPWPRGKPRPLP